jgi:hypothetical protein
MFIKQVNENAVELAADKAKILFTYAPVTGIDTNEYTAVVGAMAGQKFVLMPGEYEFDDVTVIALEAKEETDGNSDVYAIHIDGVSFLFTKTDKLSLKKEQWDLIGEVNVLVTNVAHKENIKNQLSKISPAALVVINYESAEQVAKETDLTATESEKKLKFVSEDFTEEDPVTTLYLLTK